jgi:hypothetical protein
MSGDRYHFDLVGDGDDPRAELAAARAKIVELEREVATYRSALATVADRVKTAITSSAATFEIWNWYDNDDVTLDIAARRIAERVSAELRKR